MSHRKASLEFGIPRRTILNKLKGYHVLKPGVPPIFSEEEENVFVNCIIKLSDYGFPMGEFDLKMVVKHYLQQIGRVVNKFKANVPGHEWVLNFLKRHPQLTKRFADNIKKSRAGITNNDLRQYISFLSTELEGVPSTHIFNFDETNLVDDPGKKRLLQDVGRNILSIFEPPPRQGRLSCFAVVLRENCYRCLYYINPAIYGVPGLKEVLPVLGIVIVLVVGSILLPF